MSNPYPSRKRLDHRGPLSIGTTDAVYFITIAAAERGTTDLADNADAILSAARHYQSVGKWFLHIFLIMPDHIHMLVHVPAISVEYGAPGGHALPSPIASAGRGVPGTSSIAQSVTVGRDIPARRNRRKTKFAFIIDYGRPRTSDPTKRFGGTTERARNNRRRSCASATPRSPYGDSISPSDRRPA